jgi:transcriptional regulator with XRE-family HTH domain
MKVGQQIQLRMDELGVSVAELAKRVGVSGQAVRHWIQGRSFPGKKHAPALESALSFNLDYTEGAGKKGGRESAAEIMERHDVELMLLIARLDPEMKSALRRLAEACLAASSGPVRSFSGRVKPLAIEPFFEKGSPGVKKSKKRASG